MSEKSIGQWQELKNILKRRLAIFTTRVCGIEFLYWVAPFEWEEYMQNCRGGKMPKE